MRAYSSLVAVLVTVLLLVTWKVEATSPTAAATAAPVTTASPVTTPAPTAPTRQPTTRSPTQPTKAPTSKAPTVPGCPNDPRDTDGDGITDCNDKCPQDFNKINPGLCGCGVSDALVDLNRDGFPECPNGQQPNLLQVTLNTGSQTAALVSGAMAMFVVAALHNAM